MLLLWNLSGCGCSCGVEKYCKEQSSLSYGLISLSEVTKEQEKDENVKAEESVETKEIGEASFKS